MKERLPFIAISCLGIALLVANVASTDVDDSDIINPNWVKPGHYHHHGSRSEEASCPPPVVEECKCPILPDCPVFDPVESGPSKQEDLQKTFVYYRKFVRRIFDERRLQADLEDESFMVRNIQFRISKQQVEKLKEARTPSEIDDVLTEIVEQSKENVYYAMAEGACRSLYSFIVATQQNGVFLYGVLPAIALLVIVAIAKRFNMRWWIVAPLCALIGTYIMTYRDCNNRLELQSLIKVMKRGDDQSNPCKQLTSWFSSGAEANCMDYLQNVHGLKRAFCDPSEVAIEMLARLPMKYFGVVVDETNSIIDSVSSKFGWMRTILMGTSIMGLIYTIVTTCIPSSLIAGFKYWRLDRPEPRRAESIQNAGTHQPLPQQPINVNIVNYTRPRRTTPRSEPTPSRIEEIKDGAQSEAMIAPPPPAKAGETVTNVEEHGSGDGPVTATEVTQPTAVEDCDESSSEVEDTILIQGQFPEEIRQAIEENERKKSNDQSNAS
ncbi:uncharacterized protein LOC115260809 [Aedes albopictus]|uniref:Secreted protein n=1 Tax=Aedes albopictus TaxID=7160 RepID=A0ABM1ZB52_AEDAL|nr:uncharacterized protein LOC115260809 [Aedes albopictus]KXJ72120.1 hypothetical protein RP20_CCG018806 [Aedes albopictus]